MLLPVGRFEWTSKEATRHEHYRALNARRRPRKCIRCRFRPILQAGNPQGMRKLADAMERALRTR